MATDTDTIAPDDMFDGPPPPAPRYARRDRRGRFVRAVNVDIVRLDGVYVNDSTPGCPRTHAHDRCGNIVGTTTTTATADGFLCGACIDIPVDPYHAAHNVAPSHGTAVCERCDTELPLTKYPTAIDAGYRVRGATCRACNAATRVPRAPRIAPEMIPEWVAFVPDHATLVA